VSTVIICADPKGTLNKENGEQLQLAQSHMTPKPDIICVSYGKLKDV
jgi:hypothetical protein